MPDLSIAPDSSTTDVLIAPAITPDITGASLPTGVPTLVRPRARGKFIFTGDEKFYVRGVSYGAFHPDASGREYHDLRSEEHTSELQSRLHLVCRLLLEKKKKKITKNSEM